MKTRTILIALLLIFAVPAITSAQVGNMLKNKMGRVVNAGAKVISKEMDKKIDSTATKETEKQVEKAKENRAQNQQEEAVQDTAADSDNGSDNSGSRPAGGFNLGGLMGGGKVTSKYRDTYAFNNRIYTEAEMYDKENVTKMNYFIYFSDNSPDAGFESKMVSTSEGGQMEASTSFVADGENKSFIMMTDMGGMRIGIISDVPDENAVQDQGKTEKTVPPTITKTGNTKVIAGYKCDEYTYTDNNTKEHGKIWATKEIKLNADKRTFAKAGMSGYYGSPELDNSVVLAMEQYNSRNVLELKSETKEVNLGFDHSISTTGYSFRQMNFNQAGQQKK